ncbi:hypothetical protein D6821_01750 [Candidatus Parcubacteria bacterium]|nr:MAG: hypothetical protein D6821_01750 [Candidatus Parcubacteria bacterium]
MVFIGGLFILGMGLLFVIKTEGVLRIMGRMDFFEKHLGTSGGSRLGYKMIGLILIGFGILMVTGLIDNFLAWLLSPLLKYMRPIS